MPAAQAAALDLGNLLEKISENDSARWMVAIDGLDHGPLSGRELVSMIVKDEVVETCMLLNMESGERKPIGEWPEFLEFLEQQKLTRKMKAHALALAATEGDEKRSGRLKLVVIAAVIGLLAIGGGVFALTRQAGRDAEIAEAGIGDLYESGEIQFEAGADLLPDPPQGSGMRRRRRGGGGGGGLSYDEAMNQAVDLGDVSGSGGQRRLSPGEVTNVMNRHINRIYRTCVVPEVRRGSDLGNVTIDLAILGDGSVMGASARQGSQAFKSCIGGAVRSVRFPTFPAPRMGARYRFSVD